MIRQYLVNHSEKFISHWLILTLDLMIAVLVVPVCFWILHNLNVDLIVFENVIVFSGLVTLAYSLGFLLTKSYRGVIRHTSSYDAVKVVFGGLIGFFALIVANTTFATSDVLINIKLPYALLILHFFLTVFSIVIFRFFIKLSYYRLTRDQQYQDFIMIFGASSKGIITKNAITKDKNSKSKVVLFVDDDLSKNGKTIEGIPVYHQRDLTPQLLSKYKVSTSIIAIDNLSKKKINSWVDFCLQNNIGVKQIPPLKQWIDGKINPIQIKKVNIEDLLQRMQLDLATSHIRKNLSGKVVMVTGAAGSIGSEITTQVFLNGAKRVVLVDQAETPMHDLLMSIKEMGFQKSSVKDYIVDVLNVRRMRRIFDMERPDIVFHAAAYKHVPLMEDHPMEAFDVNVCGTKYIADLAGEFGVEKFVMVSTDKAVRPTSIMGATKRLAEMYVQSLNSAMKYDTKYIITRFGNVLGSNGSVIPTFKKQIEAGGPVTITHVDITRYFMTIPEACHLVLEAGIMGNGGETFIFDMGKPVKIIDLAKKMIALSGFRPNVDIHIKVTGLRPGEKLYEELWIGNEVMLPTHHKQIMIASAEVASHEYMENKVNGLSDILDTLNIEHQKNFIFNAIDEGHLLPSEVPQ